MISTLLILIDSDRGHSILFSNEQVLKKYLDAFNEVLPPNLNPLDSFRASWKLVNQFQETSSIVKGWFCTIANLQWLQK
ncbi:hypothetical protein H0H87_002349 [Tephrocybe sp. NHM501043]|nr:hypothetical protein H0H87_002349 [Tephrocybe sp. NHM501043]